ncbi:MAG TPA: GNAT family N-acetyltransferase [Cerasibacillus sp.]|uniref:GNAT family N-acetyltransferase n=1 Tax=Cerasibacillus sp. TaxID=2498711 RepID=UPI002F3EEBA2
MSFIFRIDQFNTFTIKKATLEDVQSVYQMLYDIAQILKQKGVHQWEYLLDRQAILEVEAAVVEGATYIVVNEEQLVATFNLSQDQSEWDQALWGERNDDAFYLHRLAVHPTYRHQQIGLQLLSWIEKNLSVTNGLIRLDCVGGNQVLNEFYRQAGYMFKKTVDIEGTPFSLYEKTF